MRIKYENENEKLRFEGSIEEFNAVFETYKSFNLPIEKAEIEKIVLDKSTYNYVKESKEEK